MNDLVDRIIAERRAEGAAGDTTDLLGRMLTGVDKQTGEQPAGREHPGPVHHLPHRRPRDDVGPAVVRDLLPDEEPGRAGAGARRGRRGARHHGRADVRAGAPAALRPADPRRDAAAVADRARLHPHPYEDTVIGGRYAVPAGTPITVLLAGAAPRHRRSGAPTPTEFNPDHIGRRADGRAPAATPTSRSAPGSGPASAASSPCRRPCWCSACWCSGSIRRPPGLPAARPRPRSPIKPDELSIQVQPRPDVPARPRRRPRRGRGGHPQPAAEPAPHVARHGTPLRVLFGSNLGTAEAIATRLAQEGTERGFDVTLGALDEHVDDLPRGRRHARRCSSYNGTAAGQRRRVLPVDQEMPAGAPRASPTPCSAAATPSGPHLPGRAHPARRRSSPRTAAPRPRPRRGQRRRRLRRRLPQLARAASGPTSPPRSACPAADGGGRGPGRPAARRSR